MLDWLLQSDFNTQVTAALWSTIVAIGSTVVLFLYTLGLRLATTISNHQRVPLIARWRRIFAAAAVMERPRRWERLPTVSSYQTIAILEEWNLIYTKVTGSASDNLIALATHMNFPAIARRLLHSRQLSNRLLAIQTLGHLKDRESWSALENALESDDSAVSIIAAAALIDIDAERALPLIVPMIAVRRDWLQTRVAMFLRSAGSQLISEPLGAAIIASGPGDQVSLLKFGLLMEVEAAAGVADELLRTAVDPGVLAAALDLLAGYRDQPKVTELAFHDSWLVRLRVAQFLGRSGREEHLPVLEALLVDPEWWVRYRAAQSIAGLPFVGPNALRQLQHRQTDEFARDILAQVIAEAGLS
jgi:HEAT repeat protein